LHQFGDTPGSLGVSPLLIDVRIRAEPTHDGAVRIAERLDAGEGLAKFAVGPAQAELELKWCAAFG